MGEFLFMLGVAAAVAIGRALSERTPAPKPTTATDVPLGPTEYHRRCGLFRRMAKRHDLRIDDDARSMVGTIRDMYVTIDNGIEQGWAHVVRVEIEIPTALSRRRKSELRARLEDPTGVLIERVAFETGTMEVTFTPLAEPEDIERVVSDVREVLRAATMTSGQPYR